MLTLYLTIVVNIVVGTLVVGAVFTAIYHHEIKLCYKMLLYLVSEFCCSNSARLLPWE